MASLCVAACPLSSLGDSLPARVGPGLEGTPNCRHMEPDMKKQRDEEDEDLGPAPIPSRLLLTATPFVMLLALFFLQRWLSGH